MLEAFITFAYTGEIQITPGNVQATLIGASFLNIDSVRNFCCRYIEERCAFDYGIYSQALRSIGACNLDV